MKGDLDPDVAFIPYAELEPPVEPAPRTGELAVLSSRGARQVARARKFLEEDRFTEAALELERALRYDPNHPDIHRTLAQLHWEAGNTARAQDQAKRAVDGNPGDALSLLILGRCHAASGADGDALLAFRNAAANCDENTSRDTTRSVLAELAAALAHSGYLEASLEQFHRLEQEHAGADPAGRMAGNWLWVDGRRIELIKVDVLTRLGRFSEAADAIAPLIEIMPHDESIARRLVQLLGQARRWDEAATAVGRLDTDDVTAIALLSEVFTESGHPERIVPEIRKRVAARPEDPRLILLLADALIELQRADEALEELSTYSRRHPDTIDVRAKLVVALVGNGSHEQALSVAAAGITAHPDRAGVFEEALFQSQSLDLSDKALSVSGKSGSEDYLIARVYSKRGERDKARKRLESALQKLPTLVPARATLAELLIDDYDYAAALKVVARQAEDTPEHAALELKLGTIHERLDQFKIAERHFKAAVQLDRSQTQALLALADIYRRTDRELQAQRQLRALIAQDPGNEEARESLAFLYLTEGEFDAAVEQFDELSRIATKPTTKARCRAIREQFGKPDPDRFRKTLQESMENAEPDARTWVAIAESYREFTEAKDARIAYLEAIKLDPRNTDAELALIQVEKQLVNYEAAQERLSMILPRRPNRHGWRRELIDLYFVLQDYDSVLALAKREADRPEVDEADRRRYHKSMVDALRLAGRKAQSIALLKDLAADGDSYWTGRLAEHLIFDEKFDEALQVTEKRLAANPDDPNLQAEWLEALAMAKRFDRATQFALDDIQRDPDGDRAIIRLIIVLAQAERFEPALELVRSRLLVTIDRERFQDLAVTLLNMADKESQAVSLLESLLDSVVDLAHKRKEPGRRPVSTLTDEQLSRRPNEPIKLDNLQRRMTQLRLSLSDSLLLGGKYREAEGLVSDWLDATRDAEQRFLFLTKLSRVHQFLGRDEEATEALDRALALQPANVTLNNDVAYGWANQGVKLDEAEKMSRFAVWRRPRQAAYLDTYGWVRYKQGAFEDAEKWLMRASLAENGDDPVVLDHLGDALWRLNRRDEAIARWNKAMQLAEDLDEDAITASDLKAVLQLTPAKLEAAQRGAEPDVAPTGQQLSAD